MTLNLNGNFAWKCKKGAERYSTYITEVTQCNSHSLSLTLFHAACFFIDRLWHQLTLKLTDFVKDPHFKTGDGLIQVTSSQLHYCTSKVKIRPGVCFLVCLFVVWQLFLFLPALWKFHQWLWTQVGLNCTSTVISTCNTSFHSLFVF